jgi:hypothetical protein
LPSTSPRSRWPVTVMSFWPRLVTPGASAAAGAASSAGGASAWGWAGGGAGWTGAGVGVAGGRAAGGASCA